MTTEVNFGDQCNVIHDYIYHQVSISHYNNYRYLTATSETNLQAIT